MIGSQSVSQSVSQSIITATGNRHPGTCYFFIQFSIFVCWQTCGDMKLTFYQTVEEDLTDLKVFQV